jgi:hypothetical protein
MKLGFQVEIISEIVKDSKPEYVRSLLRDLAANGIAKELLEKKGMVDLMMEHDNLMGKTVYMGEVFAFPTGFNQHLKFRLAQYGVPADKINEAVEEILKYGD